MAPPSAPPSPLPTTTASPSPPPLPAVDCKIVNLILRCFSLIVLIISLIVMATNSFTTPIDRYSEMETKFDDIYAYRYMLSTAVIGMVYMLLQTAFAIYHITMGTRLSNYLYEFDFYGDKVISYFLATGAAATFGVTIDAQRHENTSEADTTFFNKANAAASVLLIAFVCSAISSVFSSLAVSKKH